MPQQIGWEKPDRAESQPIRVVHLISGLGRGGAEVFLSRLLQRMDQQVFSNQVISMTDSGPVAEQLRALGIGIETLDLRNGLNRLLGYPRIVMGLRRSNPALIQSWMYHADLAAVLAAPASSSPPVIWNIRSSELRSNSDGRTTTWIAQFCARLSGLPYAVVANSESGKEYHRAMGYHPKTWKVIHNGVDPQEFKPDDEARNAVRAELGASDDNVLIGLVARYAAKKDHPTFLRAAELLQADTPNVIFVLCGKGVSLENLSFARQFPDSLNMNRFRLLGERPDIERILPALDISICSSSYGEGFPNVVAEAMACELPCVVTDVGDSAYLVGNTGFVVPPADPEALAASLKSLVEIGHAQRMNMGQAARKRIQTEFHIDQAVREYEALYLSALETQIREQNR